MYPYKQVAISKEASLRNAMEVIDRGALKVALVVSSDSRLLGLVTDGDIRRGLLSGLTLNDPIDQVMSRHPVVGYTSDSRDTIVQLGLRKSLSQIPIVDDQGTLVGIELIDKLFAISEQKNWVVLMAGGLGTRLRPLTWDQPKPMLPIGGRPLLETIITNFANQGFRHFKLCLNYKAEMIQEHFGDGSKLGVHIDYVLENKRMGTAGALSLMPPPEETFFVMNGDLLTDINFSSLLDFHRMQQGDATLCVREHQYRIPYGVVSTNDGQVTTIDEKPLKKTYVNAGIYLFEPSAMSLIPKDRYYDMTDFLLDLINNNHTVNSFPIHEYWLDIGQHTDYERAKEEYAERNSEQ